MPRLLNRSRIIILGIVLAAATAVVMVPFVMAQTAPQPNPGCSPNVVPVGQANPPGNQLEPLFPVWCMTLATPNQPGRVTGANDWLDDFDNVAQYGRFDDGDYDYHVYSDVQHQNGFQSRHFTNNQHWMDDNAGHGEGGTMLSPRRSFKFENGTLVVEQDVAANVSGYGGSTWPEIDISTAPAPTGVTWDNLYGYGQFGGPGNWTFGCRLSGTNPICSMETPNSIPTGGPENNANCFESGPHRLMELSFFEVCGSTHTGGTQDSGNHWRTCSSANQEPDMNCRDRFRMELSGSGLKFYVNGFLYFQDSGWLAARQIDPAAVANGQWYVYATDWQDAATAPAYRFHWDRFAVNPHNPDGSIVAPSAAPNFCLGRPGNVCPMVMPTTTSTPVPSATATSTPSSTATPTVAATATLTPTAMPSSTATPTVVPTVTPTAAATCEVNVRLSGVEQGWQSCVP